MRVLVSNDDGVDAPGIRILAQGLRDAGHEVLIVAPDRDRSGASNSLTLDMPLRVEQIESTVWRVYGTPTDCVHVAITGMFELEPDIVVSGINNTANLGDDVIYSGTVAAAMEGRFLGLPAIAMSLATVNHDGRYYETAARAAVEIVERLKADPLPADTILNVNVPDRHWSDIAGFEVTRLGNRHRAEPCNWQEDPRGRTWWWICVGRGRRPGDRFPCRALRQHLDHPIHVDLTLPGAGAGFQLGWRAGRPAQGAAVTPRLRLQPEAIGVGMTSQRVRDRLIERLRGNGIADERVLNAIRTVPRHLFVDEALATRAYEDTALPIGHGQTISQPWVVARMTEALFTGGHAPRKVLEVGTGSGYQAAVLAALGLEVHTVERIGDLLRVARKLRSLAERSA